MKTLPVRKPIGVLLLTLGCTGALSAASFSDDFASGILPGAWEVIGNTVEYTIDDSQGDIRISKPVGGDYSLRAAGLQFSHALRGDFDVRVNFRDANINRLDGSPGNQIQINLEVGPQLLVLVRSDELGAGHNVHVWRDPPAAWIGEQADTATAGRFRFTRTGTLVSAYLDTTLIHQGNYNTNDATLSFILQNNGTRDATSVTFDNFSVTADEIILNPQALALEIHRLAGDQAELGWPAFFPDAIIQWSSNLTQWARLDLSVTSSANVNRMLLDPITETGKRFFRAAILPIVQGVQVESGWLTEIGSPLQEGALAYTDREFEYNAVPSELLGLTPILTANDDKFNTSPTFMSFVLSQDAAVYVAYDDRYQMQPEWLSEFADTGLDLQIGTVVHSIYRGISSAGTVILGGNYVPGEGNYGMYTVLVGKPEVSFVGLTHAPLYVGSYLKVPVLLNAQAGLTLEDLDFIIPEGQPGGSVSLSRDETFDPNQPDIILLTGYRPGTYRLQAVEKATGQILGEGSFTLTADWPDVAEGPSLWISGDYERSGIAGAAWGGGSPTQPENYNVFPVTGTRRVAVLLLDTASQRFLPSEINTVSNLWREVAFDGRLINGIRVSTADYFSEASYNTFTITGRVFGPVQLPNSWSSYLQNNGNYKPDLWKAAAIAGDPLIDYTQYDSLVCVIKTVPMTASNAQLRVWAHADSLEAELADGKVALGTVDLPADGSFTDLVNTLAHELGHNLGLGDVYSWNGHTPQIQARELFGTGLMARGNLAHPTLVHRMMLGWVPTNALKLYNFQAFGGFVDETISLHPVELANPAAGRYSGIEVRIAPGWNYYFEYRSPQSGQFGDHNLWWPAANNSATNRVLGTDASFVSNLEDASRRKPVMVLRMDGDGDGPILGLGQDYRERDVSVPNFPTDFTAEVTHLDGDRADVRIQYAVDSQPDPSIRPWNPPVYRSPDIEVRNAKSLADPKWTNVPWENHSNSIVAKVTNRGDLDAPGVRVDFYIKDYTVNTDGVQPILVGSDQRDVPVNQTVEFSTPWRPGAKGHYCIEARILLYQTPGPNSVIEVTELNNRAQSNYDFFISKAASPASREITSVRVQNPYDEPARVGLRVAKSTSPLFRTYIEHLWLNLQPNEARDVRVMFEYAYGDEAILDPVLERYIGLPNDATIEGTIVLLNAPPDRHALLLGGVSARVVTGHATRFDNFWFDPQVTIGGRIVTVADDQPVTAGKVILASTVADEPRYATTDVNEQGEFQFTETELWETVQAFYIGTGNYADSESDPLSYP